MLYMIRFLHFSDLHIDHAVLGRKGANGLPVRVNDMLRLLDEVVDYAIKQEVDFVLFAGDAYHDHDPKQEIKELVHDRLLRLARRMPVYLIVGNHDRMVRFSSRHALYEFKSLGIEGIHVIDEPCVIEEEDYIIVGVPWQYKEFDASSLYVESNRPIIGGIHATVWGSEYNDSADTSEFELSRDFVLSLDELTWMDYVGLGHIHRPQVLCEDPLILYPGSVGYHTWGEASDPLHGFVDVSIGEEVEYTFIPFEDRERIDLDLYPETEGDVWDALPEPNEEVMYRITITWPDNDHKMASLVENYFAEAFSVKVRERNPRIQRRREEVDQLEGVTSPTEKLEVYFNLIGEDFDNYVDIWREIEADVHS